MPRAFDPKRVLPEDVGDPHYPVARQEDDCTEAIQENQGRCHLKLSRVAVSSYSTGCKFFQIQLCMINLTVSLLLTTCKIFMFSAYSTLS
jgi:hypothetical protein